MANLFYQLGFAKGMGVIFLLQRKGHGYYNYITIVLTGWGCDGWKGGFFWKVSASL